MPCRFCEEYEIAKKVKRKHEGASQCYTRYYACLYEKRFWKSGGGLSGTYTHKARPLNFCPECGRRLKAIKVKKNKNLKIKTCKMCVYYERMGVPGVAEAIGSCPLGTISDSKDMQHECKFYRADEGEV